MACPLKNIELERTASGETWGGLTMNITDSDDTQFSGTLSAVAMTWKNSAGAVALTLFSATAGQITINTATPYAWSFTVEDRIITLPAGFYTWAIRVADTDGLIDADLLSGTHEIITNPHA
jgi:hypothetical protein